MYRITKTDGMVLGYVESVNYIKIGESGDFAPASYHEAIGVAFDSVPYNLAGHKEIEDAETVTISEMNSGMAVAAVLGLLGGAGEVELAMQFRRVIQLFADTLDDAKAIEVAGVYDEWTPGMNCEAGKRIRHRGKLYKVKEGQAHTALAGWEPDVAVSMFERIDVEHAGTADDPIPYSGNMVLENGLYYEEDGEVYKCTRDSVNALYAPLCDLVGIYVELL